MKIIFMMIRVAGLAIVLACPVLAQKPGLVAVIVSKGQFRAPADEEGMQALAELAHQRGFPVTWLLKPVTVDETADRLKQWHKAYGDEVGWYAEFSQPSAEEEFGAIKKAVSWQAVQTAGQTRYDRSWVRLAERMGIKTVWGVCFEQTYADNICDRGAPFGFYYLRPECYKTPNTNEAGLVASPWVSNDPNLVYRMGWQSGFTFDPNDVLNIGVIRSTNIAYWTALVDQYLEQTAYNPLVPLIIQQEYESIGQSIRAKDPEVLEALGALFDYLKKRQIRVVTLSEAASMYRQANPRRTPPTYALFDNLGNLGLAADPQPHPKTKRLHRMAVVTNRIVKASGGQSFNGYFANDFRDNTRYYFHPEGKTFRQHGSLLLYYDVNGLLVFEEGRSKPSRITSYLAVPNDSHKPVVLPELSMWYDTEQHIPEPVIDRMDTPGGFRVKIQAQPALKQVFRDSRIPYGIMLWGDYSRYRIPDSAPPGTKILGSRGLLIPFVLLPGENTLDLQFVRFR